MFVENDIYFVYVLIFRNCYDHGLIFKENLMRLSNIVKPAVHEKVNRFYIKLCTYVHIHPNVPH